MTLGGCHRQLKGLYYPIAFARYLALSVNDSISFMRTLYMCYSIKIIFSSRVMKMYVPGFFQINLTRTHLTSLSIVIIQQHKRVPLHLLSQDTDTYYQMLSRIGQTQQQDIMSSGDLHQTPRLIHQAVQRQVDLKTHKTLPFLFGDGRAHHEKFLTPLFRLKAGLTV